MFDSNLRSAPHPYPAGICLFKVNSGNTKAMCEICSKFTTKTLCS